MSVQVDIGGEVDAKCGKCKDITLHIVMAKVEGEIAKVKCKRCGAEHKYRPPKSIKKTTKRRTTSKKAKGKDVQKVERPVPMVEPNLDIPPKAYSMDQHFEVGERIDHSVFGIGVVEKVLGARKVQVCFEDARRILRQAAS